MYFVALLMKSENFRTQHPLCSVSTMDMCMLIKLTYSVNDIVGVGRGPVRPQHGRSMGTHIILITLAFLQHLRKTRVS